MKRHFLSSPGHQRNNKDPFDDAYADDCEDCICPSFSCEFSAGKVANETSTSAITDGHSSLTSFAFVGSGARMPPRSLCNDGGCSAPHCAPGKGKQTLCDM